MMKKRIPKKACSGGQKTWPPYPYDVIFSSFSFQLNDQTFDYNHNGDYANMNLEAGMAGLSIAGM